MADNDPFNNTEEQGTQPVPQYGRYNGGAAQDGGTTQIPQYGMPASQPTAQYGASPSGTPQYGAQGDGGTTQIPQYGAQGDGGTTQIPQYGAPASQPAGQTGTPQYGAPQYGASSYTAPAYGSGTPQYGTETPQYGEQQPRYGAPYDQRNQPANPFTQPYAASGGTNAGNGEPPLWMPWYGISFPNAVVRFFKKYATFSGRASRSEYWWTVLFLFLVSFVLNLLSDASDSAFFTLISWLWSLAVLIPSLAISVRRLHDTDKSGPWLLLPYGLEFVGGVMLGIGGVGMMYGAVSMSYGYGGGSMGGAGVLAVIGILMSLAGVVLNIVLFATASKPEGARFDRPEGGSPYGGANAYPASNQQNPYQQNTYAGYQNMNATAPTPAGYQQGYTQPAYGQGYTQPAQPQPGQSGQSGWTGQDQSPYGGAQA